MSYVNNFISVHFKALNFQIFFNNGEIVGSLNWVFYIRVMFEVISLVLVHFHKSIVYVKVSLLWSRYSLCPAGYGENAFSCYFTEFYLAILQNPTFGIPIVVQIYHKCPIKSYTILHFHTMYIECSGEDWQESSP